MKINNFNQDWYGTQAKVLSSNKNCVVVDYGCKGRGIVRNYNLFEGIQLCFLDFETNEAMKSKKFNSDITFMLNGTEENSFEVYYFLPGDCIHTATLHLSSPGA